MGTVVAPIRRSISTESTLGEMLEAAAHCFGGKPLVVAVDRTVSFEEMYRLASSVAANLSALGISTGARVTLWMENGWQWMAAYYGVLQSGAIVNPVNILLTLDEVSYIARHCASQLVLTSSVDAHLLAERTGISVFSTGGVAATTREVPGLVRPFDDLLSDRSRHGTVSRPPTTSQSVAAIGYSSGTTGHPKGAMLTHASIVTNTLMTALMHGRTRDDTFVSSLPCSHVYGNIVMNSAVATGATLVLLPRFDEVTVIQAIEGNRATVFDGVPTMYMKLLNHARLATADLSSLRVCTVGGQTMPVTTMEEVERRFGCRLVELWGMTEIGGLGMTHPYNGPGRLGAIGVPMPMVEARIVSVDDPARVAASRETGELSIRGPIVMRGYFGDAEATMAALDQQGWLRTGDLVRQDEDGFYYVVDRLKEVIISGGYNVYPAEVERVIAQLEGIAMVAVAAGRHELKGQVPKAFVVLRPGATCLAETIVAHCRKRLAPYKVPSAIQFVEDLPRNSSGKVLRRVLAENNL
jgi:long-chain acyl-CoA synthetase